MPNSLSHRMLRISTTESCLLAVRRTWSDRKVGSYAEICHLGSCNELSRQRLQVVDGFTLGKDEPHQSNEKPILQ